MTRLPSSFPGETRICPHCKATILKSEKICPACHHYLRYEAIKTGVSSSPTFCPLRIEGTLRHSGSEGPWEYSVILEVQDDRGKVISNQVMGVGALLPAEARIFTLRVNVFAPDKSAI
jgi:hypothetical protein